ncbi:XRE family transcriptional regulator [Streptomyces sp. NPDC046900]|uniref:helix-turn-helix domain-containing protein n=1 Tax=Streptomyces sp. NPDC046900 TaxID=3155473 RepID=UPI0033D7FFD2
MAESRTDFSDLIRRRRAELGISLRDLAARAIDPDTGEDVKHAWINKAEKAGSVDAPRPATLRALSVGLGIPLRTLQEAAAAQFLDFDAVWSGDQSTRILLHRVSELDAEAVEQLTEIVETFARRRSHGTGKEDAQ